MVRRHHGVTGSPSEVLVPSPGLPASAGEESPGQHVRTSQLCSCRKHGVSRSVEEQRRGKADEKTRRVEDRS